MPVHVPASSDLELNERRPESMFSEWRQFHFSSVILSYFPLSSSKEKRELERDRLDTVEYKREELGELSFV